jgi:hypothetical protein
LCVLVGSNNKSEGPANDYSELDEEDREDEPADDDSVFSDPQLSAEDELDGMQTHFLVFHIFFTISNDLLQLIPPLSSILFLGSNIFLLISRSGKP